MYNNRIRFIKLFLRLALAASYLSAVADRFGIWDKAHSVWGNWDNFVAYTRTLLPAFLANAAPAAAIAATLLEIVIALALLAGIKIRLFANLSGVLLLIFALSMTFSLGVKAPLDYSVFTGAAVSFALASMRERYLDLMP